MANENSSFQFGNVGGNVQVTQLGDNSEYVGGDKITNTGFEQAEQKQQFVDSIEELRGLFRELKTQVENDTHADADARDDLVMELMSELNSLRSLVETAQTLEVGTEPPAETETTFERYLDKTESFIDRVSEFGEKVAPLAEKAMPILFAARRLFGIP